MISERLKRAILTQLKLPNMELTDETKATDVPGWDSLEPRGGPRGRREGVRRALPRP